MADGDRRALAERQLALEQDKLALEASWRRTTFLWSIASAILSAVVTITVALIAGGGAWESKPAIVAPGPVVACRDSLRRLETLSNDVSGQTVASLSAAIGRHRDQCDDVLVKILAGLAG